MKKSVFLFLTAFLVGCSSANKMKQLDVSLTPKGKINTDETVGLNSSGEAVIQQKQKVSDEIRGYVWVNNNLEQEVSSERSALKRCRVESSDPRLGGTGEMTPVPEVDGLKEPSDVKEQVGLVNDEIVVVKEEYLRDRLALEKKYNQTLENMLKLVKNNKDKCEEKLAVLRVKHGLPAKRYQGSFGVSIDGKLIKTMTPHEKNLDDAFAITEKNNKLKEESEKNNKKAEAPLKEETPLQEVSGPENDLSQ